MQSSLHRLRRESVNRCSVCDRTFGLVRHYSWRTALCSKKCCDRFNARKIGDRIWLETGAVASVSTLCRGLAFEAADPLRIVIGDAPKQTLLPTTPP